MKNTINLLLMAGTFYIVIVIGLYIFQDKLIFMNSFTRISELTRNHPQREGPYMEEVTITTEDNVNLKGWLIRNSDSDRSPLLIYFGGNAQEVSDMASYLDIEKQLPGWSLLLMNYRGYGASEGKPSEEHLVSDAHLIYDTFAKRSDIDEEKIVAMGWSLGTGVAVNLTYYRPVQGVILFSPYDSITKIASRSFPFVPVRFLLKHPFDSLSKAHLIETPAIAFAGNEDRIIPLAHTERLMEGWAAPSSLHIFEGKDHYFMFEGDMDWELVNKFLEEL